MNNINDKSLILEEVKNGINMEQFVQNSYKLYNLEEMSEFYNNNKKNKNVLYVIAMLHQHGKIFEYVDFITLDCLGQAIELGSVESLIELGRIYYKAKCGVQQNILKAEQLFKKAIIFKNCEAMKELGHLYFESAPFFKIYTFKYYKEALNYYIMAYNQGDKTVILNIIKVIKKEPKLMENILNELKIKIESNEELSIKYFS